MIGIAAAVGVVAADVPLVVDQRVQNMQCLAGCRRDQLAEIGSVAARDVRVDFEPWPLAVVGIAATGVAAETGGTEELAV